MKQLQMICGYREGITSGGVPEAITDTIPLDRTHVTRIDIN